VSETKPFRELNVQIEIKNLPPMRVASVSHTGPYNQIGPAFHRLAEAAGPAGLFRAGAVMLGVYHDNPMTVPAEKLRSAAAITMPDGQAVPKPLEELQLPGGRFASVVHRGSYEGLGDTWQQFVGQAFAASGHKRGSGPSLEIYRNTPEQVSADQLITELYVPIG
jgi:AraC family transcriptional regulator